MNFTAKQRKAASNVLGYAVDNERIQTGFSNVIGRELRELRKELREKEKEFKRAGGRGVLLADEIDDLRIVIAVLGCPS